MYFALQNADRAYWSLITGLMSDLLEQYPAARIRRVYVGDPRKPGDLSMGFYDEDTADIWFNAFWFSRPPAFLQAAAREQPHFHGLMVEEPRHVVTHEFAHALEYGMGFQALDARIRKAWVEITKAPARAPAEYAIVNPTEYFAELFACVQMGLANTDQQAQLWFCLSG